MKEDVYKGKLPKDVSEAQEPEAQEFKLIYSSEFNSRYPHVGDSYLRWLLEQPEPK